MSTDIAVANYYARSANQLGKASTRVEIITQLIADGIIKPEQVETLMGMKEIRLPSGLTITEDPSLPAGEQFFIPDYVMIDGHQYVVGKSHAPGKLAFSAPFEPLKIPFGESEDVEDVDLADRCEQLERELARERSLREHYQAEMLRVPQGFDPTAMDYVSKSDHKRVLDELADAREALQIERKCGDKLTTYLRDAQQRASFAERRLTAQNNAVECAMRYVKVQSARYQRELLAAIDELERCPK